MLRERDMTAGEIGERFDLSPSTMSGHFNVLKAAGLIVAERNRTKVVYSINMSAFDDALGAVIGLLRRNDGERPSEAGAGDGRTGSGESPEPQAKED